MRPPLTLSAMENLVVVSGASRGIGLAFTSQLLRRTGATVIATSRSGGSAALSELSDAYPGRVLSMQCDVTDQTQTKALASRVKAENRGKVELVLNVAGLLHDAGDGGTGYMPERSLASIDAAAMSKVLAVNAIGPVLMTQAFAPQLTRGAIVANLSARVGSIGDNRLGGWWSYRMSKAALNMATMNMANELRRRDVYAVALHPGTTDTGLSEPFQKNVVPEKLFTAEYSTGAMLDVLDSLGTDDSGSFFAYDGSRIEF